MTEQDDILYALQFVKVTVEQGIESHAGYLTDVSCHMLLVQLNRNGFEIKRAVTSGK